MKEPAGSRNQMRRSRFFFRDYWLESAVFGEAEMSEGSQFASAMVVMVFAALMLVAGQLHIKNASARVPAAIAVHQVSLPL
jgi:uncharacterized membrane protein